MKVQMDQLLELVVSENCSDLHIRVGLPPVVRLHGSLVTLTQVPPITPEDSERLVKSITSAKLPRSLKILTRNRAKSL